MSELLPKSDDKKFELQFGYMINCPVICWVGFEDSLTQEQKEKYKIESMINVIEIFEKEQACDYHVCIYFSQATLVAKPSHDWSRIYFYLMQKYFGLESTDFINDGKPMELEADEIEKMEHLKHWIFKQQIDHIKSKIKQEKK
jgi:hypothetical protein